MKNWNTPEINEINLSETADGLFGLYWDGAKLGDGVLNLHGTDKEHAVKDSNGNAIGRWDYDKQ